MHGGPTLDPLESQLWSLDTLFSTAHAFTASDPESTFNE
ncbi:hypothetical protein CyaNS01_00868 [Cyanobium sp. NS01]|nr:hypothetical protein CyaNS01_00868 [Cyanobium sp. NS01]